MEPSELVSAAKFATLPPGASFSMQQALWYLIPYITTITTTVTTTTIKSASNGLWIDLCNVVAQPTSHHRSLSGGRVTCAKTTSILWSGATQNKTAKKLHTYHSINVHRTWQLVIAADICSLPAETSLRICTQAKEGQEGELM